MKKSNITRYMVTGLLFIMLFITLQGCSKKNELQSKLDEQNSVKAEWGEGKIIEVTRDFEDDGLFVKNLIVTETIAGQRVAYYDLVELYSNLDNPTLTMQVGDSVSVVTDGSQIKMN